MSRFFAAFRKLPWPGSDGRGKPLPAGVREAISCHQHSSEVLVSWVQLGVVLTFTLLYTLTPKTFTVHAPFAPVPWALGAYLLLTLGRLFLALRSRLRGWLPYVSVLADFTLLFGLIWSFHLQYGQPPAFYLKAPTLMYVFIFIALRALNFRMRFVVLAGIAAACGWLVLLLYAIAAAHGPVITHDYVAYMTSNKVLIGAESDKIITIAMVTVVLAVAIARSRRLLLQAVSGNAAARELSRFLPNEVAARIRTAPGEIAVGTGELREATILFTDIEGFTSLAERLTPQAVIETLNAYFTVVVSVIERHGGTVNQFQGDAILASFNVPRPLAEHAACAVEAAVEIQRRLAGMTFGEGRFLCSRIGINTGVVVGGLVGTPERVGYTVHGDAVNVAARLEQLNKSFGTRVLVAASTYERTGPARFAFEHLGAVEIRGRHTPTSIYAVQVVSCGGADSQAPDDERERIA